MKGSRSIETWEAKKKGGGGGGKCVKVCGPRGINTTGDAEI